jgi:hypothetical protein
MTEKLHTDLREELIRTGQLKTAYVVPLFLSTMGITPKKKT